MEFERHIRDVPTVSRAVVASTIDQQRPKGKTQVFTTEMNRQMLSQRSAAHPGSHRHEHLRLLRESGHPPSRKRIAPLRAIALILASTAGRIDRETARRAIA